MSHSRNVFRDYLLNRCSKNGIKAAFIRAVNQIITDREYYITELNAILQRLGNGVELECEKRILDEQLDIDAKAVNDLIAENARVAQSQSEYKERNAALVARCDQPEKRRNEVVEQISRLLVLRRKISLFIQSVKELRTFH